MDAIKVKKVTSVFADKPAISAVETFAAYRQKTLLVYDHGTMIGAVNTYLLYSKILQCAASGKSVTDFLLTTPCRELVDEEEMKRYLIVSQEATVFDVFVAFEEKRDLTAVIVTENGVFGEKALSIITPSDFPRINRFLENYNSKPVSATKSPFQRVLKARKIFPKKSCRKGKKISPKRLTKTKSVL